MEELENEIHRYKFRDIKKVIEDIKNDMRIGEKEASLYTISLVRTEQLHKLPNVNISNLEELKKFYDEYSQSCRFSEIWVCKKRKDKEQNFSVGRVSFETRNQRNSLESQTIEQVWNVSHRDIESYNDRYEKAYVRASRITWGMRYNIQDLNIPKDNQISKEQMTFQFIETVKEIEKRRENIENFEEYLRSLEINQFSLEYLLQEGKFLFIDWDSKVRIPEEKRKKFEGKSLASIFPTKFCNDGCAHCFFKSGKRTEEIPQEQYEFSDYGIDRFIEFINQSNNGYLLVIGGGEPFEKFEQILKIVEQVKTDRLVLVTNGIWAKDYEEAKRTIFELYTNFKKRKTETKLILRLSTDKWHAKQLGYELINHIIDIYKKY